MLRNIVTLFLWCSGLQQDTSPCVDVQILPQVVLLIKHHKTTNGRESL